MNNCNKTNWALLKVMMVWLRVYQSERASHQMTGGVKRLTQARCRDLSRSGHLRLRTSSSASSLRPYLSEWDDFTINTVVMSVSSFLRTVAVRFTSPWFVLDCQVGCIYLNSWSKFINTVLSFWLWIEPHYHHYPPFLRQLLAPTLRFPMFCYCGQSFYALFATFQGDLFEELIIRIMVDWWSSSRHFKLKL